MAGSEVYRLFDDVLSVDTPEETVLLAHGAGKYFGLRGAARHVFGLLRTGATLDAMVNAVSEHFSVDAKTARDDLTAVLAELRAAKLISVESP